MLHIKSKGFHEPYEALKYWKHLSESKDGLVSPLPFNMVTKTCFSFQSSSAPEEILFSDLGKMENNDVQSTLTDNLEMTELIRINIKNDHEAFSVLQ